MVLLNDWSARDLQQWEYIPLGPFNSKTFATSISPWVVTMEALQPFRVEGPVQDPAPLPYLATSGPQGYDIHLEAALATQGKKATTISQTNFSRMPSASVSSLPRISGSDASLAARCARTTPASEHSSVSASAA